MKVVIPGGSGQVGTILARTFHAAGHEVVVLSRHPVPRSWRVVGWTDGTPGGWTAELEGCDALINLSGRSVNCRYTAANRAEILHSRVTATRILGAAIAEAARPPRIWLQASTATIYKHSYDAPNDEASGVLGGAEVDAPASWKFSIEVAQAWERAFDEADTPRTRRVILRSAMIMSPDEGGVFDTLQALVRCGLGGAAGNGRQFVSWIHFEDFIRSIRWLIDRDDVAGVVNLAAPNPLPNAAFMRALREAAGVRFGLPAARWMLEIGAALMRTESELILKSRRVVPGRLLESGFEFAYPEWRDAAHDLVARWRAARSRAA
jgi:uncharacterized protein (TIGR01777 family)